MTAFRSLLYFIGLVIVSLNSDGVDTTINPEIVVMAEPVEIEKLPEGIIEEKLAEIEAEEKAKKKAKKKKEKEEEQTLPITEEELELLALITFAEAEGESEEGMRLVIDTVLNRVDSGYFPDSIEEVVYQKYQFSSVWNGRLDVSYVDTDICELVSEEVTNRTNYDCVYFTAGAYSEYGTPMFQVGNHYFSSY